MLRLLSSLHRAGNNKETIPYFLHYVTRHTRGFKTITKLSLQDENSIIWNEDETCEPPATSPRIMRLCNVMCNTQKKTSMTADGIWTGTILACGLSGQVNI